MNTKQESLEQLEKDLNLFKSNYELTINALQDCIIALRKIEHEKKKNLTNWIPKKCDRYYIPHPGYSDGVYQTTNHGTNFDKFIFENGWQTKTHEESSDWFKKFTLIKEMDDWCKIHNPISWNWKKDRVYGLDVAVNRLDGDVKLYVEEYGGSIPTFAKLATTDLAREFKKLFEDRIIKYLI